MFDSSVHDRIPLRWLLDIWVFGSIIGYLILSHRPELSTEEIGLATHSDKWMHFLVYFYISWISMYREAKRSPRNRRFESVRLSTLGWLCCLALLDEFTQPWFGRTCDALDLVADGTAIVLSLFAWQVTWWCFGILVRKYGTSQSVG